MKKEVTCIICPLGCKVVVEFEDGEVKGMEGHQCKKGEGYAINEVLNPVRTLTTTLKVRNGVLPLVSVKTSVPVPKDRLFKIMDAMADMEVEAPIHIGNILVKRIEGLEADIMATKNVQKKNK